MPSRAFLFYDVNLSITIKKLKEVKMKDWINEKLEWLDNRSEYGDFIGYVIYAFIIALGLSLFVLVAICMHYGFKPIIFILNNSYEYLRGILISYMPKFLADMVAFLTVGMSGVAFILFVIFPILRIVIKKRERNKGK